LGNNGNNQNGNGNWNNNGYGTDISHNNKFTGLTLNEKQKVDIGKCFSKIEGTYVEWLKSLFLYKDGMDCFRKNTNYKRSGFYNLTALELLSGLKIDQREGNTITADDSYTGEKQLLISPKFAKWLYNNFVLVDKDSYLFKITSNVYQQNKYLIRTFYYSHQYLSKYKQYDKEVKKYQLAVDSGKEMLGYLSSFYPDPSQNYNKEIYEYNHGFDRFRFGIGFWLRRGIDGTNEIFNNSLIKILNTYDYDWYNKQKNML
jgi:hypothetical protein